MHKLIKGAVGLSCLLWVAASPLYAMPPLMDAGELSAGMTGTGYTVFDATGEVRPFQVDVVGIADAGKGSDKRIMAKASGPQVEKSRGVLQGMSGSPVYIEGRLVGALSYGNAVDSYTFFITPIHDMLTLWNYPDHKNKTQFGTVDLKQVAADRAKAAEKEKEEEAKKQAKRDEKAEKAKEKSDDKSADKTPSQGGTSSKPQEDTAAVKPSLDITDEVTKAPTIPEGTEEKAQLYLEGFDGESLNFLQRNVTAIAWDRLKPLATDGDGSTKETDYHASLIPGSPVGVALVCGDFFVGATGTVTAVEGNRILAFGHPFMHRGNVNYFLTDAAAVGTIGGYGAGMRVANPGKIIGRVNQDREYGIAGILGRYPSVVPMRVSVKDFTPESVGEVYNSSIAYDEAVLPQLSAGVAYASMNRASDRQGEGSAKVHFVIRTNAIEGGRVERSNMFYNLADVGQVAILELAKAMTIICTNTEREADILDVQMEIAIDSNRRTASLVSAVPEKTKVKPGETVNIKTTLQPYRQEKQTVTIPYIVPKTQREGTLHLDVRGGGFVPVTALMLLQQQGVTVADEENKQQTMQDKLKELTEANMNNEIIIAPGAAAPLSEKEQKKAIKEAIKASAKAAQEKAQEPRKIKLLEEKKPAPKVGEAKAATDYVIDNVIHTTLQVTK